MIVQSALQACAKNKSHKARQVSKFIFRALVFYPYFRKMVDFLSQGDRMMLLNKQPKYLMKCMVPFIHVGLNKKATLDWLNGHYQWLENTFTDQTRETIYLDEIILAELEKDEQHYLVTLSFDGKARKEGELTLSLKDTQGSVYYLLAFTYHNGSFYIGCIQGSTNDNGFSHQFTKTFYGMRPKSFMVATLQLLAQRLEIKSLYAVKNNAHIYNAKRYHGKAQRFNLNYDQLWEELDGISSDEWFFQLPVAVNRRPLEDIKRSRRKTYRERYAWLDSYENELSDALMPCLSENFLTNQQNANPGLALLH
ncbi:VirK/YbjX family protein [Celerinatantimonas sp. MCCC 1A17872]|uniref:VirK/YbjX family protein n=1 Tax=Celerinatantimonas sp. MCCC 1A17872 TaxID=3177514 RepID=UPI0038C5BF62